MIEVHSYAKLLIKDIASLPEEKMRLNLLGERFNDLDPIEITDVLNEFYKITPKSKASKALLSILVRPESLMNILGIDKYHESYTQSIKQNYNRVTRLFTDLPPQKSAYSGYTKEEEAKMEDVSLGRRRSMAKSFDKNTLDRLISDPDPMVIGYLLDNPKMIERDVLKITSKRPNSPTILKVIATHRKWSKRYSVRKSIVLNPYTPPRISLGLIEFLMAQDIKLVADSKSIHPQLKQCARELLDVKKRLVYGAEPESSDTFESTASTESNEGKEALESPDNRDSPESTEDSEGPLNEDHHEGDKKEEGKKEEENED